LDWELAIISVHLYRNYKTCHQTLKANVNEYVDETTIIMWIWNEDDEQSSRGWFFYIPFYTGWWGSPPIKVWISVKCGLV